MNNILAKSLFLMAFVLLGCKSLNEKINVFQEKVNSNIIIRSASDDKSSIITIQFPSKLILSNNSKNDNLDFLVIDYKYGNIPESRNLNLGLFTKNKGELTKVRNNKKKTILPNNSLDYIIYSRHFVDSSKFIQQQFKPYVERMLQEKKDTLHIGTVSEFKQKHKELFEKLTKNDSISIQFLDGKKLGKRITVPVKW